MNGLNRCWKAILISLRTSAAVQAPRVPATPAQVGTAGVPPARCRKGTDWGPFKKVREVKLVN